MANKSARRLFRATLAPAHEAGTLSAANDTSVEFSDTIHFITITQSAI